MKPIIIITGLCLGLILGLFPAIDKQKPTYWKIIIAFVVALSFILTLYPPIATPIYNARYLVDNNYTGAINVVMNTNNSVIKAYPNENRTEFYIKYDNQTEIIEFKSKDIPAEFNTNNKIVAKVKYDKEEKRFDYISTVSVNPILYYPYIPELEERIKIMNIHVPIAWVSVLAYLVSMIYSVKYLRTRKLDYDLISSSSAWLGLIFTLLATFTGMIWAKMNWGSYWNWDPREVSIFVLLLIYSAYFALRSSLEHKEIRAKLSSVYSIIAFITVPFFIFILPRISSGLHPGSKGGGTAGPVLSTQGSMLNINMSFAFSLGMAAFTALFFWMLSLDIRVKRLKV
jgi:heme exporter protein C